MLGSKKTKANGFAEFFFLVFFLPTHHGELLELLQEVVGISTEGGGVQVSAAGRGHLSIMMNKKKQ